MAIFAAVATKAGLHMEHLALYLHADFYLAFTQRVCGVCASSVNLVKFPV